MNGLFAAIGFLTIIPTPRVGEGALASARMWFPVVGLGIGALLAVLDWVLREGLWALSDVEFPPLLLAALLVTALVIITRALHLDGFMDTCDGLFGGAVAERRLEIMRDPRVGAFAVVGAICLMLLLVTSIAALTGISRSLVLLIIPCLSRWAMVVTMAAFPYARQDGLGSGFLEGGTRAQTIIATVLAIVVAAAFAGGTGVILLVVAGTVALNVGRIATRRLGGVTGDVYGAVNELATMAMLVVAALLTFGDLLPIEPLWASLNLGGGDNSYAP